MRPGAISSIENRFLRSVLNQEGLASHELKNILISDRKKDSFIFPLLIELVQRIDESLKSLRNMGQLSKGRFSDKVFGDHFNLILNEEADKIAFAFNGLLNYMKVNRTTQKVHTIHTLMEDVLKKYQAQLEGKRVRVYKKFEQDLPEITTPDELLNYIFDSILMYAIVLIPPNGGLGFITRTVIPQKGAGELKLSPFSRGKLIDISIFFDGYGKTAEPIGPCLGSPSFQQADHLDFELRLIDEMVKKDQGTMGIEIDSQKGRTSISLRLPVERRNIIHHQTIN